MHCAASQPLSRGAGNLSPFVLWLAFPTVLAGRDSCGYYGDSVPLSLAAGRESRIPLVRHEKPRVGAPFVSFILFMAERPFAPESSQDSSNIPTRCWYRLTCATAGVMLHRWGLGFKQFAFTILASLAGHGTTHVRSLPL
jgi:hypothetical protein